MIVKMMFGNRVIIWCLLIMVLPCHGEEKGNTAKTFNVSVSGQVKFSQVISINRPISLGTAIEICGGMTKSASPRLTNVLRKNDDGTKFYIPCDLRDMKDKNFLLQDGDMIMIYDKVYWSAFREIDNRIERIIKKSEKDK